jgi:hypothetical protein
LQWVAEGPWREAATLSDLDTARTTAHAFVTSVVFERWPGIPKPPANVFASGMPSPAASSDHDATKYAARVAKATAEPTKTRKSAMPPRAEPRSKPRCSDHERHSGHEK